MSPLFTPFAIGPLTLPNRIVIAPMCQYSAEDGQATDWHLIHLGQLSLSGAGLLILEATAVEPIGRITNGDLGLYDDATEAALARVMTTVRRYSPMPVGIQLAHAGRKSSSRAPWEGGSQVRPDEPGGWLPTPPLPCPMVPMKCHPMRWMQRGWPACARPLSMQPCARSGWGWT
jgi:2,4-dienoyl-CoA reductase-like NADH-dependent reductase (Old Yellow Enzyme family)